MKYQQLEDVKAPELSETFLERLMQPKRCSAHELAEMTAKTVLALSARAIDVRRRSTCCPPRRCVITMAVPPLCRGHDACERGTCRRAQRDALRRD